VSISVTIKIYMSLLKFFTKINSKTTSHVESTRISRFNHRNKPKVECHFDFYRDGFFSIAIETIKLEFPSDRTKNHFTK